jgi:hypothetical protein
LFHLFAAASLVVFSLVPLWCQAPLGKSLGFEVASIKQHPMNTEGRVDVVMRRNPPKLPNPPTRRFTDHLTTAETLIIKAYDLSPHQVLGLPGWAKPEMARPGDYFDVDAVAPIENPTPAQLQSMLQGLLAERFLLRTHWETRELSVYLLTVGKHGAKFNPVDGDAARRAPTMYLLMQSLSKYVSAPIVDRTGLTGSYDFALDLHRLRQESADSGASVPVLLNDRLGLELKPAKESMEVLVVEHIQKPSAN